jgi:hypothetical protein
MKRLRLLPLLFLLAMSPPSLPAWGQASDWFGPDPNFTANQGLPGNGFRTPSECFLMGATNGTIGPQWPEYSYIYECEQSGDFAQAARFYRQLARNHPTDEMATYWIDLANLYEGKIDAAMPKLVRDIRRNGYGEDGPVNSLCLRGRVPEALQLLDAEVREPTGKAFRTSGPRRPDDKCQCSAVYYETDRDLRRAVVDFDLCSRTKPLTATEIRQRHLRCFNHRCIRIFFQPTVSTFDRRFKEIFLSAMDQWVAASNKGISYQIVGNRANADIVAMWSQFESEQQSSSKCGLLGNCAQIVSGANLETIQQSLVHIPVFLRIGTHLRDLQCLDACLHQLGHALGIPFHTQAFDDVLSSRPYDGGRPKKWLTEHDRVIARCIYSPTAFPATAIDETALIVPLYGIGPKSIAAASIPLKECGGYPSPHKCLAPLQSVLAPKPSTITVPAVSFRTGISQLKSNESGPIVVFQLPGPDAFATVESISREDPFQALVFSDFSICRQGDPFADNAAVP